MIAGYKDGATVLVSGFGDAGVAVRLLQRYHDIGVESSQ